jgi:hypothetical protein
MSLLLLRWHSQGWGQRAGCVLILLSVMFVCLGPRSHDHDALCADRQHVCHTLGCWGFIQDPCRLVVPVGAWLLQCQQGTLPLDHPLGVFRPPRPLLLQLSQDNNAPWAYHVSMPSRCEAAWPDRHALRHDMVACASTFHVEFTMRRS